MNLFLFMLKLFFLKIFFGVNKLYRYYPCYSCLIILVVFNRITHVVLYILIFNYVNRIMSFVTRIINVLYFMFRI